MFVLVFLLDASCLRSNFKIPLVRWKCRNGWRRRCNCNIPHERGHDYDNGGEERRNPTLKIRNLPGDEWRERETVSTHSTSSDPSFTPPILCERLSLCLSSSAAHAHAHTNTHVCCVHSSGTLQSHIAHSMLGKYVADETMETEHGDSTVCLHALSHTHAEKMCVRVWTPLSPLSPGPFVAATHDPRPTPTGGTNQRGPPREVRGSCRRLADSALCT